MNIKKLFIAFTLGLGLTLALVLVLSTVEGWLLGGGWLPVTRAASFNVNTTNDENDGCGTGQCSLRDAIIDANGNGQADTITLGNNTYVLTQTGVGENAAATGDLDITDMLTIEGVGPGQTIIDASGVISDRVFDIQVGAGTVVISGVTIINGNVTGNGGGIRSRAADLTLVNVEVISNAASISGGGVYVYAGSATLQGGQIFSNTADVYGGGVFAQECSAALSGTKIVSNTANRGGGLYILSGSATLSGGQILSNSADYGGGVCVEGFGASGDGVFTQTGDSIIAYNTAAVRGGGMYVDEYSRATLNGAQILSNTTAGPGGGVCVWEGSVTLNEVQVLRNAADSGGGLYAYAGSTTLNGTKIVSNTANLWGGGVYITHGSAMLHGIQVLENTVSQWGGGGVCVSGGTASVSLINATISGNTISRWGGGLYASDGAITITYTTIASNTASTGDGIYRDSGTVALQNTIVAYNGAANCYGGPTSNGHNLDSGVTCGFSSTGDITDTNPLLGPLAEHPSNDSGQATWVYPLLEGSPAIDAGACVAGITTDQRGVGRPQNYVCDIGAYEFAIAPTSVSIDGPTAGLVGESYVFTAAVSPPTATLPITYTWSPAPDSGQGTDAVTYSWGAAGDKAISVTVENIAGSAPLPGIHTIEIRYRIYLPLALKNYQ